MKPFDDLVRRAEREWSKCRHRLEAFPAVAARLLSDFEYGWTRERLDRELAGRLSGSRRLPEQVALHNTFGQPPITLFNNRRLVVDLYLWVAADTSLHSHGFRGAFQVLHGRSLHETFSVRVTRRIAPGVARYDPGPPEISILDPGDVRPILPGVRLTHRVIHLECPTVTLCIRTINEPRLQQWEYFPDGLAVQRHDLPADVVKKLYYYDYLLRQDEAAAEGFIDGVVGSLKVVLRLTLHESLRGGSLDLSEAAVEGALEAIRRRHGASDWFRRREGRATSRLKELHFAGFDSALGRLLAHGVNEGYPPKTVAPHLARVAGRELGRRELAAALRSLLDFEFIFGCALPPHDRETIRELIVRPDERIPRHLEPFPQIRRMRSFLRNVPDGSR